MRRYQTTLGDPSLVLGLKELPDPDAALSEEEKELFGLVDGRRTLGELVAEASLNEYEAMEALFRLIEAGWIEIQGRRAREDSAPADSASTRRGLAVSWRYDAMLAAAAVAFAILGAQWQWPAHGEGGRVLYAPGAIALLALVVPLRSSVRALRVGALAAAVALVLASAGLAHSAVERWVQAGSSMRALGAALVETAATLPAGEYAFVVAGDHLGAVPFARNAQLALLVPPVAPFALSSRVVVQVVPELPQWPGLFARDAVGRLMREPLIDALRAPPSPAREPPYRLPDRFLCWDAREHVLRPVALELASDAGNWDAAWAKALASPACAQVQP